MARIHLEASSECGAALSGGPVDPVLHSSFMEADATSSSAATVTPPVAYATLTRRVNALVLDGVVMSLVFVLLLLIGEWLPDTTAAGRALIAAFVGFFLLYEPVLVSSRGGTIGHRLTNLRVVADRSGANPTFLQALARFLIKTALGMASFLTMAFTARHQGVHDRITRTTVQIRNLAVARAGEYYAERPAPDERGLPPAWRRFAVIVLYLVVVFLLYGIADVTLRSSACLRTRSCSFAEELGQSILGALWLVASGYCIIAGWRGQLLGARRRPADPPIEESSV